MTGNRKLTGQKNIEPWILEVKKTLNHWKMTGNRKLTGQKNIETLENDWKSEIKRSK